MKRIIWVAILACGWSAVAQQPQNSDHPKQSRPSAGAAGQAGGVGVFEPAPPAANKQPGSSAISRVYSNFGGSIAASSASGIPPVVVRFSGGDEEANAALEEELTIMTHLLERALQRGIGDDEAVGIKILYSEGRSVRSMYIDGFGALFMIKVRFPVFAPSAESQKAPSLTDSEWDKAKRELYNDGDDHGVEVTLAGGGPAYEDDKVEELKKTLLQSLKYAVNMHSLKPSDFVGLTVFGQPSAVLQVRKPRSKNATAVPLAPTPAPPRTDAANPGAKAVELQVEEQKARALARNVTALRSSPQGTVMTLRAKKIDVDDFASGKLNFDGFQTKVEQNSYAGSGYGITSINSWSKAK